MMSAVMRHTAAAVLLLVATPAALALKAPPDVHITAALPSLVQASGGIGAGATETLQGINPSSRTVRSIKSAARPHLNQKIAS